MKDFIVLAVTLPLMLLFFAQFTLTESSNARLSKATDIIYAAREEAKQEGIFTEDIKNEIKMQIAKIYSLADADDILIECDEDIKYRNSEDRLIHYKVTIPVGRLNAGDLFFKKKADNYTYTFESYTPSEKLK